MCSCSMCHGVGEGDCVTGWVCVYVVCVMVRGGALCDRVGMCSCSMCPGAGEGDCVTGWVCVHVVCVMVWGRGTV